jgi:hypothetical protein
MHPADRPRSEASRTRARGVSAPAVRCCRRVPGEVKGWRWWRAQPVPRKRGVLDVSGLLIFVGLVVFVVGLVGLIRGRLGWARIATRKTAAAVVAGGFVLMVVGGALAPKPKVTTPPAAEKAPVTPSAAPSQSPSPSLSPSPGRASSVPTHPAVRPPEPRRSSARPGPVSTVAKTTHRAVPPSAPRRGSAQPAPVPTGAKTTPPAPPPVIGSSFSNCTDMHSQYPHGVGRPGATDHTSGNDPVTTFQRSTSLYDMNSDLDRDQDGVACEKR